jgi:RNA polymerase sigma-70 factor (ECF subfamily)
VTEDVQNKPGFEPEAPRPTGAVFATTQWTVVLGAGGPSTEHARLALEELCRIYWRPIYAFVRRLGHSPHDAQDLTQEFFARLLASRSLDRVHPERGRFRSFLLSALKHFLANEWDKVRSLKRGGGQPVLSFDSTDAETAVRAAETRSLGPEQAFDRQWTLALLDRVLARLQQEHLDAGKAAMFAHLKETLTSDRSAVPYAVMASRLGVSEGSVKVAVHRIRQRYRQLLREEISHTLADPAQAEQELRDLFAALAG